MQVELQDGFLLWGLRVIIPPELRDVIVQELHQTYPGMARMKALAQQYAWWLNLDAVLEAKVRSCATSQLYCN